MNRGKVDVESCDTRALRRWVVGICIIRFDLEQGQLIEECFPEGCVSPEEELDIAFSSFPDSMSQSQNRSTIHDCIFFFRIRRRGVPSTIEKSEVDKGNVRNIPGTRSPKYLYGYVFNRQRQDERLKRGGEQKSVVILSHMPYVTVFKPLLQILGPLYFDIGKQALEHIGAFISRWPAPIPGKFMELAIGNATLKSHLPPSHTLPSEGNVDDDFISAMAPVAPLNQSIPQGLFHESDLFGMFRGVLLQLWMLWELLLIGEPLLVIAPTPSQCCEAVAGLVSLIAPLPCSIDFRPYFTIHDPDFSLLNSLKEGEESPPMILGVTNLFFLKALQNLPHIVSVGTSPTNANKMMTETSPSSVNQVRQLFPLRKFSPANLLKAVKLRRDGPLSLMTEHKEALWTSYISTTKPDTAVLNRLVDGGTFPRYEESMSVVNNEILRRHFLELTTNFLSPFGPFLRANTPPEGISPFVEPPPLPSFDAHEFLEGLAARGPGKFLSKRMRANWLELYRNFLRGPNFMPWFQRRRAVAEQEQHRLWSQARAKADIQQFLSKMSELELVDSFHAVERQLRTELECLGSVDADASQTCQKLKGDLQKIFKALPKDMQELLLSNPQHTALLQGGSEFAKLRSDDP